MLLRVDSTTAPRFSIEQLQYRENPFGNRFRGRESTTTVCLSGQFGFPDPCSQLGKLPGFDPFSLGWRLSRFAPPLEAMSRTLARLVCVSR